MRTFLVCTILILCCLASGCWGWAYKASTDGMLPSIKSDDTFTVNPFAYYSNPIERFDIVLYEAPDSFKGRTGEKSMKLVKRVIGLPGEKIEIVDNKIYINDVLLKESFEKIIDENDRKKNFSVMIIPENEYFLLGDNRPHSEDSRYYQPSTIKKKDIYSKVLDIYPKK